MQGHSQCCPVCPAPTRDCHCHCSHEGKGGVQANLNLQASNFHHSPNLCSEQPLPGSSTPSSTPVPRSFVFPSPSPLSAGKASPLWLPKAPLYLSHSVLKPDFPTGSGISIPPACPQDSWQSRAVGQGGTFLFCHGCHRPVNPRHFSKRPPVLSPQSHRKEGAPWLCPSLKGRRPSRASLGISAPAVPPSPCGRAAHVQPEHMENETCPRSASEQREPGTPPRVTAPLP